MQEPFDRQEAFERLAKAIRAKSTFDVNGTAYELTVTGIEEPLP
jgi:hypothetical protein